MKYTKGKKLYRVETTNKDRPVLCTFEVRQIRKFSSGRFSRQQTEAVRRIKPPVPAGGIPLLRDAQGLTVVDSMHERFLQEWFDITPRKALHTSLEARLREQREANVELTKANRKVAVARDFYHLEITKLAVK